MKTRSGTEQERAPAWLLAAVALLSFSLLAFEITATRVLSAVVYYHYAFVVISLALLGSGAGGILIYLRSRRDGANNQPGAFLVCLASLFSLSAIASVLLVSQAGASLVVSLPALFAPFLFGGAFLAQVLFSFPRQSGRLYGVDLAGAAAGSLGAIFLLDRLGGIGAGLAVASLSALAALAIALVQPGRAVTRLALPALAVVVAISLLSGYAGGAVRLAPRVTGADKEIAIALKGPPPGQVVESRWTAFGKTDLLAFPDDAGEMALYVDGAAGTSVYRFNGDLHAPLVQELRTAFPGFLPVASLRDDQKDSALVIGPGGGRDILVALLGGIRQVTAVEVNPDIAAIMAEYRDYNSLYAGTDQVSVVVGEGRSYLKRQSQQYDAIMLTLPITKTSRSVEGFVLTENYLFTKESLQDYWDHLTDEGRLVVVAHDSFEAIRMVTLSVEALAGRGLDASVAMKHIYVIGSHHFPVFVLAKSPLAATEMETVHRSVHELGYEPRSSYLPTVKMLNGVSHDQGANYDQCASLDPMYVALEVGALSFDALAKDAGKQGYNLTAVTDDRPFFYKFSRGLPGAVSAVFWPSALALLGVMAVPLVRRRPRTALRRKPDESAGERPLRFLILFAALGVSFMLVEISAIQRFTLFLGQPVLALGVLLFALLVGGGLGSLASGRVSTPKLGRAAAIAGLTVAALLVLYAVGLPLLLDGLLGLGLAAKVIMAALLVVPLGFAMGFPFPLGIRLLKESGMEKLVPWVWGINGIASVAGSALTIIVAITLGFTAALFFGAVGYLIVTSLCARGGLRRPPSR